MKASDIAEIEQSIIEQIEVLEEQFEMTAKSSKPVALDQALAGRVSRIDAIQQQKIAQAGFERSQVKLVRLKRALLLLKSEGFGYCQECGEPIGVQRLKIKPESTTCVDCQQLKEG